MRLHLLVAAAAALAATLAVPPRESVNARAARERARVAAVAAAAVAALGPPQKASPSRGLAVVEGSTMASWSPIRIGGGGYVPGTFFSPAPDASVYFKTDVGGAYRRSINASVPGGMEWVPLLDSLTADQSQFYSVSHLALNAADGTQLYALLGFTPLWSPCEVWRSDDAGATWAVLMNSSQWRAQCGGNSGDRGVGDRMALHPIDNATILIGSYDGALLVTRDGFASGAAGVSNISLPGPAFPGAPPVRSVGFLPITSSNSSAPPAYAAYAASAGPEGGVWMSLGPAFEDPATWVRQAAASAAVGQQASRFLASSSSSSTSSSTSSAEEPPSTPVLYFSAESTVGRLSLDASASPPTLKVDWTYTPAAPLNLTYDGLAVHPSNPLDITFVSIGTDSDTTFLRTLDGGATFFAVNWTTATMVPWATSNSYDLRLNAAASFNYDPHAPELFGSTNVWVSDFFGVWRCENWDAPAEAAARGEDPSAAGPVVFTNVEWGHEEVVGNFVKGPPVGAVLSGVADDFGWRHDQGLDAYPSAVYPTADAHNCAFSADYTLSLNAAGDAPEAVWIAGGDEYGAERNGWGGLHHYVGVSNDGGRTLKETTYDATFAGNDWIPYRVLVHPFNGSVAAISGFQGLPVVRTTDAGATWTNVTSGGAPLMSVGPWGNFWWAVPFARDNNADTTGSGLVPATFYYYNGTTTLFQSSDSGATWDPVYEGFPSWDVPLFGIATPPRGTAAEGDIWAFAGWHLLHSVNGGRNFSQVWEMYSVKSVIATGPLPANSTSARSGKGAAELSAICAAHRASTSYSGTSTSSTSTSSGSGMPRPAPRGSPAALVANDVASGRRSPYPTSHSESSAAYVVYAVGQFAYGEPDGVFLSVDYGAHWVPMTTAAQGLGDNPSVFEASLSSPGTVFLGTGGRGEMYADATGLIMGALEDCEAEAEAAAAAWA